MLNAVFYYALADINAEWTETFQGCVSHRSDIEGHIALKAKRYGPVHSVSVVEVITAQTPDELEDKIAAGF